MHETVPVPQPGPLSFSIRSGFPATLADRTIDKLAGLVVTANGRRLEWKRDPVNVYAFHVDVPAGVSAIDVDFQYPLGRTSREGRVLMTPQTDRPEVEQRRALSGGVLLARHHHRA